MIWHDPADGFNMFKPLKEKIRNQGTIQWFKAPLCQSLRIWGAASVSFDMKISPCDMHICPFHQPKSPRTSVGRNHRAWGAADIRSGHFHNDEWGPLRPPWPYVCHIWHGMDFSGLKFDPWTLPLNDLFTVHPSIVGFPAASTTPVLATAATLWEVCFGRAGWCRGVWWHRSKSPAVKVPPVHSSTLNGLVHGFDTIDTP
jgi:hypothetical protein